MLITLSWSGLSALEESSENELIKRTATTGKLFASTASAAVLVSDLASLESFIDEVLSNPDIVYARVLSKQGVLAEGGDKRELGYAFVADSSLDSAKDDGVFDAAADIVVSGRNYGRVEIGHSILASQTLMEDTRTRFLFLAALSLLLTGVFTLALAYYLTRGLHALQRGTRQIARGGLGYQIEVHGQDELGQAARDFNDMSARLAQLNAQRVQKEEEILQLNQALEQRVADRTVQLQNANAQLEFQAMHDMLTGLPNRALFQSRLSNALACAKRTQGIFALVGIDLDLFKEINDTLGHHAGDLVLQHVAGACNKCLRDADTVARMGGDEFVILLPNVTDRENAVAVAERILATIREPLYLDGHLVEVGASMGIALFPLHGTDAFTLLTHSDAAMYEAKRQKLGVVVYEAEMGDGRSETVALKGELRYAINEHHLILHYQPKIDFGTQTVSGVEALVRWQHPRLGLLYPDAFIEMAENTGLIKPLTHEVLRMVMQQIHEWGSRGLVYPVAVNISAINLQDKTFPETVSALIAEFDVSSHLLELEVTETAIMKKPLVAIENIRNLSRIGIKISIDDFGTGYSSMAYIQKLLVAKIKIDKSFVMDMGFKVKDEMIVRATIDLAHNLGLSAVAEGVENQEAWDKLHELGCDSAQGYHMSKPLSPEAFVDWVENSLWGRRALYRNQHRPGLSQHSAFPSVECRSSTSHSCQSVAPECPNEVPACAFP